MTSIGCEAKSTFSQRTVQGLKDFAWISLMYKSIVCTAKVGVPGMLQTCGIYICSTLGFWVG